MKQKVIATHTYNAGPEKLFKAWTTPEMMSKFFDGGCENQAVNVKVNEVNLKVGGKFSFAMAGDHLHYGEYTEIIPYSKLAFTWSSPVVSNTLVTIEFNPKGEKTELVLTHELLDEEWVEAHTKGWNQIFKHLEKTI